MTGLAQDDVARMRDQLFFDGPERNRRLSRFWLLLLAAVIASAGVVSDSTATGAVGSVALVRSDISDTLPAWPSPSRWCRRWPWSA